MFRISVNFWYRFCQRRFLYIRKIPTLISSAILKKYSGEERALSLRHKTRFLTDKFFFSSYLVFVPSLRVVSFN